MILVEVKRKEKPSKNKYIAKRNWLFIVPILPTLVGAQNDN